MSTSSDIDRISMIVLRSLRGPLFLLVMVYTIGIAGFGVIPGVNGEPMSFFHALYFLSYTATTTGFGELPSPFSNAQRIWAIVLLHVSVIAWLVSIGSIVRLARNRHFQSAVSRNLFARRIVKMDEPFVIICGFGDAGSLLARGLNKQALAVVIIDADPERIKALMLRNYMMERLGVCADSSDPRVLIDAGLQHPLCRGIAAVTDDEHANVKTTVITHALNSAIKPICRVESHATAQELDELDGVCALDSFQVFADRLCMALRRPALHALGDWFLHVPGATLDHRLDCPAGNWIICGYGRMGRRLEENLQQLKIDVTIIDPKISEDDADEYHVNGSANRESLQQAGIKEASCVIIATDSDTNNLRIMMTVKKLNPDAFTVIRQNHYLNEVVFANAQVDIVMHPDRVISRRIEMEIVSPGLQRLLESLEKSSMAELKQIMDRLSLALGSELPLLWTTSLHEDNAPALTVQHSGDSVLEPSINDLLRRVHNRESRQDCLPLILEHDGTHQYLPDMDTVLTPGDQVLFCGTRQARAALEAVLHNPYTLQYLISGEELPRSYVGQYLERRSKRIKSLSAT